MRKLKHIMYFSCLGSRWVCLTLVLGLNFVVQSQDEGVLIEDGEKTIEVTIAGRPVLTYNKVPTEEALNHEPHFIRSGYIHPLYTPSGRIVTGDYPADHKHQHALFFAWTKTKFEKRGPEFWNQKLKAGRISFVKVVEGSIKSGNKFGSFSVEHLWEDLTAPDGPVPVLKEIWKVSVFNEEAGPNMFEIESTQEMIGDKLLLVEQHHYGGMAIRGPDSWLIDKKDTTLLGTMLTSEGLGRIEGNHSRPEWVAMSGPVQKNEIAGVAVIPDKGNFRHPQWVRLHPNKPYFVFSPIVEKSFQIKPGEPYVSKFRYLVFDGEPEFSVIEEAKRKP
ncbi:MAG: hypothetical protein CMO61_08695 [Verrucomicrobiales bacterium]|nr:hypothetical protein [Verrucomicrobiales bacterium]